MRLLVYEFITGGGMLGEPLPNSMKREGEFMRDALLRDLAELSNVAVTIACDKRCVPATRSASVKVIAPNSDETGNEFYRRAFAASDVVWPIAPETDAVLERLSSDARQAGKVVLASDAATLACAASKRVTSRALNAAGIVAVPTFSAADDWPDIPGQWVVKPDDGAGAVGVVLTANRDAALEACHATTAYTRVAQPWLSGVALSLAMLCAEGRGLLLAVNRQHIIVSNGNVNVKLAGVTVNALPRTSSQFVSLAQNIAAALPGLWGYVGVDLILAADGELTVLEINPRVTTSYCRLHDALGINVAKLVLDLFQHRRLPSVAPTCDQPIEIDLSASDGK